jgi:hypothetical protein
MNLELVRGCENQLSKSVKQLWLRITDQDHHHHGQ